MKIRILFCLIATASFGQEIFLPVGYDYIHFDGQPVHNIAGGAGFLLGEQDMPFTEVKHRFLGIALYRSAPKNLHIAEALFDGRIERHQLLVIFKSNADKPVAGGLSTFQAGVGWGYEIIRRSHISFILGGALGVGDFGVSPVLPVPLVRLDIDTYWFVSSFDFLTSPNFSFTLAPKEKFRFTADMRMDKFRNINDFVYEYIFWYRLIGVGIKHDITDFVLSYNSTTFEMEQTAVFGTIDLSILKIQGGWISDNPCKGFYVSIQGLIPIYSKK